MIRFVASLDLGQSADYTALAIAKVTTLAEENPRPTVDIVHLERFPLGTSYPTIVAAVAEMLATPALRPEGSPLPTLVIDATGVGRPVVDMFLLAQFPAALAPMTITGGQAWRREGLAYFVPKKDLCGSVQSGLQSGRLRVVPSLKWADALKAELLNFRVTVTVSANETYGAWRENIHDDLVLAVSMAVWIGEHPIPVLRLGGSAAIPKPPTPPLPLGYDGAEHGHRSSRRFF